MDSDAEWTTNENTIYGNAAMIFLTASIMSQTDYNIVSGDVNADKKFDVLDIVLLKKYILNISDAKLINWKAGDLNDDNTLNILDLCMMKQKLIAEKSPKNKISVEN